MRRTCGSRTQLFVRLLVGGSEKIKTDEAYKSKYRRYAGSILNSVLIPQAREATFKLVPRS